jgi:hypothetical protein
MLERREDCAVLLHNKYETQSISSFISHLKKLSTCNSLDSSNFNGTHCTKRYDFDQL